MFLQYTYFTMEVGTVRESRTDEQTIHRLSRGEKANRRTDKHTGLIIVVEMYINNEKSVDHSHSSSVFDLRHGTSSSSLGFLRFVDFVHRC